MGPPNLYKMVRHNPCTTKNSLYKMARFFSKKNVDKSLPKVCSGRGGVVPYHFIGIWDTLPFCRDKKPFCRLRGWVPYKMGGHDPTKVHNLHLKPVPRQCTKNVRIEVSMRWQILRWLRVKRFKTVENWVVEEGEYPAKKRPYMMCTLEVQVNYCLNGVFEKTIDFSKGLSSTFFLVYTPIGFWLPACIYR